MRALTKTQIPKILSDKSLDWRDELLTILASGKKPTDVIKARYRHPEIKAALIAETNGKCAYCESKVRHITHGDIEHIVPKSKVPAKHYEWENLTLACDKCNENKGDHFIEDLGHSHNTLVDPYVDDPAKHFHFMRELVLPLPTNMKAKTTYQLLELGRSELVERWRERMNFLDTFVLAHHLAKPEYKEMIMKDLLENHLKTSDEYYGVSISYIEHLKKLGEF